MLFFDNFDDNLFTTGFGRFSAFDKVFSFRIGAGMTGKTAGEGADIDLNNRGGDGKCLW